MNHILVVDDNPMDRELVRGLLGKSNQFHVEFASDGVEAIEHLEVASPMLVVTDLQMPTMDGLALVKEMRRRFATIPVILMTAYGSEDIAVEAMVAGAAEYVQKHRLPTDLSRAVEGVLAFSAGDRRHEHITQFVRYEKLRYEMPNDESLIAPMADRLQQAAASMGLVENSDRLRLAKCIAEALRNAVSHGVVNATGESHESSKDVVIEAELTPDTGTFAVRDHSPGFDPSLLTDPRQDPMVLTSQKGRGLKVIQLFMDEVRFNPTGNEIVMVKHASVPKSQRW